MASSSRDFLTPMIAQKRIMKLDSKLTFSVLHSCLYHCHPTSAPKFSLSVCLVQVTFLGSVIRPYVSFLAIQARVPVVPLKDLPPR